MKLNYNEDKYEPEYLPSKYPYILFNPAFSGIGYGLAGNIAPFNVTEVLEATIKLIKNPKSKIELIPDSPTGCDIVDEGNFKEINETGMSKLTMRASTEIDYNENIITITSLPYNSSSEKVIKSVLALRTNGEFKTSDGKEAIIDIKDYTKEGEVKIEIYLRNNAKPDKVLKKLMKKNTGLKSTFPVGLVVIDDFEFYSYGVKELLLAWIDYRLDEVLSMLLNKLQNLIAKQHLLKVLIMVFNKNNIDDAIAIAKSSKSKKEVSERFMKKFKITSVQADKLAEMHIYQFNEDSRTKFIEEEEELEKSIKEITNIVENDDNVKQFVIDQLKEGIKKWGHERKSKIVKENDDDLDIPDTEHLVGITESGWIKKLTSKDNSSIGPIGKGGSNITVIQANNKEDLLIVDSTGNVVKIPLSAIPDMEFNDIGVEMKKFFSVNGDIKAVLELPSMEILKQKGDNFNILFITKKGIAKRVQISEFKKITDKKSGIDLHDGDEVAVAMFSFNETAKDIIISTNLGDGIRLPLDDIKLIGSNAKGLNMIKLKEGEEVVNASIINPNKKLLLYVTSAGRVKVTELKYFPTMDRKGEPMSLISLQSGETLLGISSVNKSDVLMVFHKNGDPEQVEINTLEPTTRIAKGDKLFKTVRGDNIVAYKVFKK